MRVRINPRQFSGEVKIPASKSHTIRQLLIASLADGVSEILSPLDSLDTRSCVNACKAFGTEITECRDVDPCNPNPADEKGEKLVSWKVTGNANFKSRKIRERAARIAEIENIQAKNYLLKNAMDKKAAKKIFMDFAAVEKMFITDFFEFKNVRKKPRTVSKEANNVRNITLIVSFPGKTVGGLRGFLNNKTANIISSIRDIFKDSQYAYSSNYIITEPRPDGSLHKEHGNIEAYHHFVNKVTVDGETYYVRFTTHEERTSVGKLHSAHISAVEITNEKSRDSNRSLLGKHQGGTALPAYDNNLTDFFNSVKGKISKIDVGNSGTTLYLALAAAGLQSERIEFTGDEQIKKRSAAPLLDALAGLGIQCESNNGCAPIAIKGPWKGGRVRIECPTSQYLSALLIAAPLAPAGVVTEIDVSLLNEKPYIDMTLSYLKAHGVRFEAAADYTRFVIPGGASWKVFSRSVPADFSSAAFPAAAAAISGGEATLLGLDPTDTQGDKFFFEMLKNMGCEVAWSSNADACGKVRSVNSSVVSISRKRALCGGTFDLNKTPDLLPVAAVIAAYAEGDTALVNVAHARIKETDRIAVMAKELAKLGVEFTELPDGLVIHGKGAIFPSQDVPVIEGHGDHRVVMAFAAAALGSPVPIEITTAESAAVTYPGFFELLGAEVVN